MKRPALRTRFLNAMQFRAKDGRAHPQVRVVSYHIPKAAGSSMSRALMSAYGASHVIAIYRKSILGAKLSEGGPVWIPQGVRAVHGMFSPHPNHKKQFPNARFVTWVRSPVARLKSLLEYWLSEDASHDSEWQRFKQDHLINQPTDTTELLRSLAKDPSYSGSNQFYQTFFSNIEPGFFDFIGSVERIDEDAKMMRELLEIDFVMPHVNVSKIDLTDRVDINSIALPVEEKIIQVHLSYGTSS